jgi:hypothetical protein
MHAKAHSPSQQTLSVAPQAGAVVIAMTAQMLTQSAEQHMPVPVIVTSSTPDEGPYQRLALRACQSEHRFPPASVCYEVEDRSMPSVSSF